MSSVKCCNYVERKIRDICQTIRQFTVIQKSVVLSWESNSNLLLAICAKWNSFPYTSKSNLCPASFLHPHSVIQDIMLDSDSKAITQIMSEVMEEITEHIYEGIITVAGLDKGPQDNNIEEGHFVAWNKSEDLLCKGLLFGRVEKQKGSDYLVKVANSDMTVQLPKQRIITLPQTAPFDLVEEEEAKLAAGGVQNLNSVAK